MSKLPDNGAEWLNNLYEIAAAPEASLRRSLLTSDGRGVKFKEACLNELLKRAQAKETHEKDSPGHP